MKFTVPILLWVLQTALMALEDASAKLSLDTCCVLDETIDGDVVQDRKAFEVVAQVELRLVSHLGLDEVEDLLLHNTLAH